MVSEAFSIMVGRVWWSEAVQLMATRKQSRNRKGPSSLYHLPTVYSEYEPTNGLKH
jgi:hypothetical protein